MEIFNIFKEKSKWFLIGNSYLIFNFKQLFTLVVGESLSSLSKDDLVSTTRQEKGRSKKSQTVVILGRRMIKKERGLINFDFYLK